MLMPGAMRSYLERTGCFGLSVYPAYNAWWQCSWPKEEIRWLGVGFVGEKGKLTYYWCNTSGVARSKLVGPDALTDVEGWLKVGELGLDKLAGKPDPVKITFGDVLSHYLAYSKKKTGEDKAHSSKNTDERNARLHLRHWEGRVAKDLEPLEIQLWIDGLSKGLRSKIRSMMSAVYNHGQKFGMIPRSEGTNPMKWVSATTVSDYEAVSLSPEESFAILEGIKDPLVRCS
jgi:hypothetical protein